MAFLFEGDQPQEGSGRHETLITTRKARGHTLKFTRETRTRKGDLVD